MRSDSSNAGRVLIIDNKDSFTFNLVQLVAKVTGANPVVIGNSDCRWRDLIQEHEVEAIIVSPGPGRPDRQSDFGICRSVILESQAPLLGVCLGHQGIGWAHGARVTSAPTPMHGRVSRITHDGSPLFDGIPRSFEAVRYHSLCLDLESMPSCLRVAASTADGIPMAVRHLSRPQFGVQFHPESVSAEFGERLVSNFLRLASRNKRAPLADPVSAPSPARPTAALPSMAGRRIVARVLCGWVDPADAFEALYAREEYAFWLDSAAVIPGYARFSLMGTASGSHSSVLLYRTQGRILETLRDGERRAERVDSLLSGLRKRLDPGVILDDTLPFDFQTGLVGFFGYEMRNEFGSPTQRTYEGPDAAFIDTERCIVFDHEASRIFLVVRQQAGRSDAVRWLDRTEQAIAGIGRLPQRIPREAVPLTVRLADGPDQYARKVQACQRELASGESYQICLSTEFSIPCRVSPYETYRALRALNPAPFAAYLRFGEFAVLSSSPERFLRLSADRKISAKPIKGTCARGANPAEDHKLARWLRTDEKFRSENLTIVDLLRNDVGRVAAAGSVHVPQLMEVESYATVHQLVSTIAGQLPPDRDCLDCLAAAFPGGSMTGAPKLRTMSIIDRLEDRPRGVYSGAVGFLSHGDRMDLSIVIRTIVMAASRVTVASGGGIVAMSDTEAEFDEMLLKARAPLSAIAAAATSDPDAWELRYDTP